MQRSLYRDDAGAAIEKAARLEEENAQLRAEIERLRREGRAARTLPPARDRRKHASPLLGAFVAVVAGLAATSAAAIMRAEADPPQRHAIFVTPRTPRTLQPTEATPILYTPTTPSTAAVPATCKPPYYYDLHGVKHFKEACLR